MDDWGNMVGWLSGRDENDDAKERRNDSKRKMRRERRKFRLRVGTCIYHCGGALAPGAPCANLAAAACWCMIACCIAWIANGGAGANPPWKACSA